MVIVHKTWILPRHFSKVGGFGFKCCIFVQLFLDKIFQLVYDGPKFFVFE